MKEMTLQEIQSVSLDILKEFDRFCKENDLKYSLAYGTLIGAVRHKGFIPWDDDVDVVMPRPDYYKFVTSYKDNGNYACFADERKNCFLAYGRLADISRTFVQTPTVWANKKTGVWIDIMPIDGVDEAKENFLKTVEEAKHQWFMVYRGRKAISDLSYFKGSFAKMLRHFLLQIISGKSIYRHLYHHLEICLRFNYDECCYVSNMSHLLYTKKCHFSKSLFEEYSMLEFENSEFMVIKDYHTFLTTIYGNYMQLPPEKDRNAGHSCHHYYWI